MSIKRYSNPNLKTSLICLSIVIVSVVGLTLSEYLIYLYLFPESSDSVEIDEVKYEIGVGIGLISLQYDFTIRLYTNKTTGDYPLVNATEMWIIPTIGIWAWRHYEIIDLTFLRVRNDTFYRIDYEAVRGFLPKRVPNQVDIIVKLNASDNSEYFLHALNIDLF